MGLRLKLCVFFALALCVAGATIPGPRARIETLEKSLLAPCCYSEPVATHNSDAAREMRAEIRKFVGEGKSDREILDTYIRQYGKRILVEPEGAAWWWMHVIPWVFLAMGTGLVVLLLRRFRAARTARVPVPAGGPLPDVPDFDE